MNPVHIISQSFPAVDVIRHINEINDKSLVFSAVDGNYIIRGTLTDGDVRRALIKGISVNTSTASTICCNFNFLCIDVNDGMESIHKQCELRIRLIPVLDDNNRICEIVNPERYRTKLLIDAVLMADGKGERLRPLAEKTLGPLIKIGDKCIIDYNIDRLPAYRVSHISVTVNYLRTQIKERFREKRQGAEIAIVCEPEYLETISSVRFVEKFYNDTISVMNSDLFTNTDYGDFYLHFQRHDADISAAAVPYIVRIPYGILNLNGREIENVVEKPAYNYYANTGIYLIKKDCLGLISENEFFSVTDFMNKLIVSGHKAIRYPIPGSRIDIGRHEELARAKKVMKHMKGF